MLSPYLYFVLIGSLYNENSFFDCDTHDVIEFFLFSPFFFSQDHSDKIEGTQSNYIFLDKQVFILEFRVEELEKLMIKSMG
ncbi:hypothetical protein [Commensalibacter papalotli (ex Botero et al. 2024)]|uniref:Uncharacterized protein n=1 Tax=Commensalibacter papalotli (ex Botero et al. 2024) TaxID=2972766 RepID=A0ABM9HKB8_9PROT|nr:hypothetical protein [Commensalibacter papalotli (ex Botero et al. 2024)]CAI3922909.1 unnamed protein product [Commensalibacter papalotli (ex Botero et al. 2024)]CAI3929137.1 unnamed protein product [Commensalibacter papalotli (ex Botero et al. 2024)]